MMEMKVAELEVFDYVILVGVIILCAAIGVYYGFYKKKLTANHYINGNKSMNIFPVAMSLIASMVSSTIYVGRVTEVYIFENSVMYIEIASFVSIFVFTVFFLPVFYDLPCGTLYEYLLLRFDKKVHILATVIVTLQGVLSSPVFLYVPALMFNQVTGIDIHLVTAATGLVCVFYTCVGGFAAVVITDTLQTIIMFISICVINIMGTLRVGGFSNVLERNYASGKIGTVRTDFDLTLRYSLWSVFLGFFPNLLMYNCLNQSTIQRCQSVSSLKAARWVQVIYTFGGTVLIIFATYSGMVLVAAYYDCDPLSSQIVKNKDQILPFFITNVLGDVTGVKGLFLAGVFSAGLSTLSTILNTLAGVILQDVYVSLMKRNVSDHSGACFMKIVIVVLGSACTGLALVVNRMGTLYQIVASLFGLLNGPMLAIFTLGVFVPSMKSMAVLVGSSAAFFCSLWIYLGSMITSRSSNTAGFSSLNVEGCTHNFTRTANYRNETSNESGGFSFYNISFFWYSLIGFILTIAVASLVNLFAERNEVQDLNPMLYSPFLRKSRTRTRNTSPDTEMKLLENKK